MLSGKDLIINDKKYEIVDKFGMWHKTGKLLIREMTLEYSGNPSHDHYNLFVFEKMILNKPSFESMDRWYDSKIFREFGKNIEHPSKSTGTSYMFYKDMDSNNKTVMDIWTSKGENAAIEHMFTDQEIGQALSYSEMRSR